MRRSVALGVLAAASYGFAIGCARAPSNGVSDPVLTLGDITVGDDAERARRIYGDGTPAHRVDLTGKPETVALYRHGAAVLAIGIRSKHVSSFVAYEHLPNADVGREFQLDRGSAPVPTPTILASLPWLGMPLFSSALPPTPPGWRVPTDFTIASSDKQFLIIDGPHAVSKALSLKYGWVVEIR